MTDLLECVVNVSEGRAGEALDAIARAAGDTLLDLHRDADHHRSVLTLAGPDVVEAALAVAREATRRLDLRDHAGAHPRLGVVDVVPFVPLPAGRAQRTADLAPALAARDEFAARAAEELGVPCFLYGPERTLPEIRRSAFTSLRPDTGPDDPDPRFGACCVGARLPLVAYNCWLERSDLALARRVAAAVRDASVRALGLAVGGSVQVSCNLVAPWTVGPGETYDRVARLAPVARTELVGLLPAEVLDAEPAARWALLDLAAERTVESRLACRPVRPAPSRSSAG